MAVHIPVPHVAATLETIHPDWALEVFLDYNKNNRPVRDLDVARLTEAIKNGEWVVNGDTIVFDTEGNLLDGQHRLAAIAQADIPVQSYIVRGIARDAMVTKDVGRRRSVADWAFIRGEHHTTCLAAASKLLAGYELGLMRLNQNRGYTSTTYEATLDRHPDLRESVAVVMTQPMRKRLKALHNSDATFAFVHYIFKNSHGDKVDSFFESLASGANLDPTSPILVLRTRLLEYRVDSLSRANPVLIYSLIVKAWNLYIRNRPCKTLRWEASEDVPKVEGMTYDSHDLPLFPHLKQP